MQFQVAIEIELWDCAAEGGAGRRLAQASLALNLSEFEAYKARPASIDLGDGGEKVGMAVSAEGHGLIIGTFKGIRPCHFACRGVQTLPLGCCRRAALKRDFQSCDTQAQRCSICESSVCVDHL